MTATGVCHPHKSSKKIHPKPNVSAFVAASKLFVTACCDEALWDHLYHLKQLVVVQKCISVTGIIFHRKRELDGDDHIQLTLDDQSSVLLNGKNKTAQKGNLVLEPVCQHAVKQTDAKEVRTDFHSGIKVPKKGTHVSVSGSYVLDSEKPGHGWMEIRPVTRNEVSR